MSKLACASKLGDLLARLPLNQPDQWKEIESTAQQLADDLRVKDAEQQTVLGKTLLPQTLTSLLKSAISGATSAVSGCKAAIHEILRVGANLCMDHDENRGYLLEANFPQTVVSLLESYAEAAHPNCADPLPLLIDDLKVVKTSIGLLLNASIGYEPTRSRLISLEAAVTILKLSMAIYPPGSWLTTQLVFEESSDSDEKFLQQWILRSGLASWAWRAISELRDDDDTPQARPLFGVDSLPYLIRPLLAFIPPYPSPPPLFAASPARRSLVQADYEVLEEVCGLLESLCLDVEDIRLSLARGMSFPDEHGGIPCLTHMLAFLDRGDYPPFWSSESSGERSTMEKSFDFCKAAVVKAVVEVAGDEKNIHTLWDESDAAKPGGAFVNIMVQWIRTHRSLKDTNRDDLIICATLSVGNLVRRDAHALALARPPIAIAPDLATLIEPGIDIKVTHGVVGLLKHLAQSQGNRAALGEARIIERLATSGVWGEKTDIAELVQVSAIGIAKHMCAQNADNALTLVSPDASSESPLDQILALVRRSDSTAVKSEGTRVLVNVVKSLWSSGAPTDEEKVKKRHEAVKTVVNAACTSALAQLIGRSKKYPSLINEGVVSLFLLSTHANGGTLVLDSILNPLPSEVIRPSQSQPASAVAVDSPVVGPRSALDMLVSVLSSTERTVAAEIRANICQLLGQLGKSGAVSEDRAADVARMKERTQNLLEKAASSPDENVLSVSAKRALDAWA